MGKNGKHASNSPKPKDSSFTLINEKKNAFKKQEPANVSHFHLTTDWKD